MRPVANIRLRRWVNSEVSTRAGFLGPSKTDIRWQLRQAETLSRILHWSSTIRRVPHALAEIRERLLQSPQHLHQAAQ